MIVAGSMRRTVPVLCDRFGLAENGAVNAGIGLDRKKAVVNHHREFPIGSYTAHETKSVGDPDAGNLLVQGDNLEALKRCCPITAGKVNASILIRPTTRETKVGFTTTM